MNNLSTLNSPQATTPTNQQNNNASKVISKNSAFLYGAFGGLIAAILDTAVNVPSNSLKFGEAITKIFPIPGLVSDTIGVFFIIIVAAVLARIDTFKTEKAAVMSGLMIFSTIAVLTPITTSQDIVEQHNNLPITTEELPLGAVSPTSMMLDTSGHFFRVAALNPNAKITAQSIRVSSCKPSYWGFLGLGSLINGSVRTCQTNHYLGKNDRVEVISTWRTGARGYWYAKIQYQIKGKIHTGWIQSGWKENPWAFIKTDSGFVI